MIPVSVITGFLGSGKTTLLRAVLRDPAYAGSAVIVNEWGEIGLDHELLETSGETLLGLANGCLCCAVRGDLARTLLDLAQRREAGAVPPYARVLIETSGLADPGPILHTLLTDPAIAERHRVEAVVTVVDALLGAQTLVRNPEAARQVALSDRVLLSKTDLAPDTAEIEEGIRALNPGAPLLRAVQGAVAPDALFASAARPDAVEDWLRLAAGPPRHSAGVETITLLREPPLPAAALPLFLEGLAEHAGERLLRLKGLVRVAEAPECPAVIHGVRHVLHPVHWLERWPSADRRTRLVLIGQGIPRWWPARLLE
ncbi:MAG TPA: GTP-binding protein, partial [Acetobacteraceae bacterium]|nr:GTP-binding protein [Acetobacteraceae bacterium]